MISLLKDLFHLVVVGSTIAYFGGIATIVYKLGFSALDLHEKGMFSLGKYNRMLVGPNN